MRGVLRGKTGLGCERISGTAKLVEISKNRQERRTEVMEREIKGELWRWRDMEGDGKGDQR